MAYTSDKLIPPGEGAAYLADDPNAVRLEHSCGEWEIGGPDEVRALIRDLKGVLNKMQPHAMDDPIWKEVASDALVGSYEREMCPCLMCMEKAGLINRIRADAERIKSLSARSESLERWPPTEGDK